ncbi:unnamed protein product [Paramecium sonneborni]|uniref:Uncharacterized protein n=1 Tax=Paramecium sonneborni TaxID=65129 RepID=A0A8S1K941_9CILI|nr:unnamed protein product [Paramecium sonneborni]
MRLFSVQNWRFLYFILGRRLDNYNLLQQINAKRTGFIYVSEYKSEKFRTFRGGGLGHLPQIVEHISHSSKNNLSNYHDKFDYERVNILKKYFWIYLIFSIDILLTSQFSLYLWTPQRILIQKVFLVQDRERILEIFASCLAIDLDVSA